MKFTRRIRAVALLASVALLSGCGLAGSSSSSSSASKSSTPALTITTTSLPDATVSQSYSGTLQATGGTEPYSWSVIGGTLPAGLTLKAAGEIAGTPTQVGSFSFQTQVTDASKQSTSTNFSMQVTGTPAISSVSPNSGPAGTQVVVNGSNFVSGATVSFGSTQASSVQFVSSSQLSVVVPSMAAGTYPVNENNPEGGTATMASAYTLTQPQSLLSGCTVDSNNKPSCAIPSGWTLAAAQGFESGAIPSSQYFSNHTAIESSVAHTGTHAAGGKYTGGDQRIFWALKGNSINSLDVYISWWEYDDSQGTLNQDFYMTRRVLYGSGGAYAADWGLDVLPGGADNNCLFACTSENFGDFAEGSGGQPNFIHYGGTASPGWGTWTQWEIEFNMNTPGNADGSFAVWRNGMRVYSDSGVNFTGSYSGVSASDLEIGGVYTYLTWYSDAGCTVCPSPPAHGPCTKNYANWSVQDSCPLQAPPSGYGIPFHRYFDDIIVLRK